MAFQIKPNKKESENKTIRFPLELIEQINQAIKGEDVSFSNFVIQACQYALDNLQQENIDSLSNR
jgi:predicted HicB family RNase H-like nuclease